VAGHSANPKWQWVWDGLDQHLHRKQLKQTRQRKEIVNCFLGLGNHVEAEELHQALRAEGLAVGLATVYRTLNMLKEAGLVEQKSFADGRSTFELVNPAEHHDHLVCVDCGVVIEFENEAIEKLQRSVAEQHGFRLTSHRLDLFGSCQKQNCANRR
jgi:Fur family transcriptional regulator, ferric uptake regulator